MEELLVYRQELISALEGFVTQLSQVVAGIPPTLWQHNDEAGSPTPHYLLAHLCELEEQVFTIQLHRILDEDQPVLPRFDDFTWMADHYRSGLPALVILERFINLRFTEVDWLRGLPSPSWSRTARHPWWGVHAFQWWVELQLEYSRQHLRKLAAFLSL